MVTQTLNSQRVDRAQVLTKAVIRAAEVMGIKQVQMAKVLGLSAATISRMYSGKLCLSESSKEWELAALFIRLFRGLDAIMAGDEQSLRAWLNSFNHDLQQVPMETINNVTGLVNLVAYVDAHRAKV